MNEKSKESRTPDEGIEKLSHDLLEMTHRNQEMFAELLKASGGAGAPSLDPLNVSESKPKPRGGGGRGPPTGPTRREARRVCSRPC